MSAGSAAELAQLAHQLGVAAEELDFLGEVVASDLRALRVSIGEALFLADRHHFARMAALARAVPVQLAAKITVLALPPLLAARTAELFEPAKAVEMVTRLPVGYLTDVAAVMDPGRSPQVVGAMPPDTVAPVGRALAERGEWVVMGAFVSHVSSAALAATVAGLTGAQLLRIGFVLDDGDRIGEITDVLSDVQLDELLAAAVDDELWEELDDLLGRLERLGGDRSERLAGRFAVAPDDVRAAIEAAGLPHRAVLG